MGGGGVGQRKGLEDDRLDAACGEMRRNHQAYVASLGSRWSAGRGEAGAG